MDAKSRPYDDFIPLPLLRDIQKRRQSPDGVLHQLKTTKRAGRVVYAYPWSKMELGDFFIVPIGNRSKKAVRIAFYQAAARHDLEISVKEWTMPDGSPGYRVGVTIIGVNKYRLKAVSKGIDIKVSDGRWRERKKRWEQNQRGQPKQKPPNPFFKGKKPDLNNPFWADEQGDQEAA